MIHRFLCAAILPAVLLLAAPRAHASANFGVTVTSTTTKRSALFTITNTGSFGGDFLISRLSTRQFHGPQPSGPTNTRVKVTYLINGQETSDTSATVNIPGGGGTATVGVELKIIGKLPLVYTRVFTTTVTATQTSFPSAREPRFRPVVTATDTATITLKGKGK